jgi:hypothetical protein
MALKTAALHVTAAMRKGVKVLAPPAIANAIQQASVSHFLEIYEDLPAAIASFMLD